MADHRGRGARAAVCGKGVQLIAYLSAMGNVGERFNGWLVQNGFPAAADILIERHFPIQDKLGVARRVFVHNPGGVEWIGGIAQMHVGQYQRAVAAGYGKLMEGLIKFHKKIKAAGGQVISYLGWNDSDITLSRADRLKYFCDSTKPFLDVGATVAFDVAATRPPMHTDACAIRQLQMNGANVMVEGEPLPHWSDTPVILQDNNRPWEWLKWFEGHRAEKLVIVLDRPSVAKCKTLHRLGITPIHQQHLWGDTTVDEWNNA
jgi:hypothetical protein